MNQNIATISAEQIRVNYFEEGRRDGEILKDAIESLPDDVRLKVQNVIGTAVAQIYVESSSKLSPFTQGVWFGLADDRALNDARINSEKDKLR